MKLKIRGACLASLLLLAGCASTSKVVPYGKDTYMVAADDGGGTTNIPRLQVMVVDEANAHCAKLGKAMEVKNMTARGNVWIGRSATLLFTCTDK
jgi:hypothetical protein